MEAEKLILSKQSKDSVNLLKNGLGEQGKYPRMSGIGMVQLWLILPRLSYPIVSDCNDSCNSVWLLLIYC